MKTKSVFIIPLMIALMVSLVSCSKSKTEGSLLTKDVALMEIDPQSTSKVIYKKDKNSKEIAEFINAYNKTKPTDNSLGTTHNHEIIITLNNGDKITVWGGTQGFQTVQMNGQQFNIKGEELWNYFEKL
jgi:hypothetical protein